MFNITSGNLVISDPCYKLYEPLRYQEVLPAKNGKWVTHAEIEDTRHWGSRVSKLFAFHEDYAPISRRWSLEYSGTNPVRNRIHYGKDMAVDSGQLGFFDYEFFKAHESEREYGSGDFYSRCCDATLSDKQYGIIDEQGVVSSSGYGDGSYPLYYVTDDFNRVVGVCVDYMSEEEYDEEEYEYEDEV